MSIIIRTVSDYKKDNNQLLIKLKGSVTNRLRMLNDDQ